MSVTRKTILLTILPEKGTHIRHSILGVLLVCNNFPIGDWHSRKGFILLQDKTGIIIWEKVEDLLNNPHYSE